MIEFGAGFVFGLLVQLAACMWALSLARRDLF